MKIAIQTLGCLALAAVSAMAIDKQFADQMMESARNIERDAGAVSLALKSKSADKNDVNQKLEAMSADLAKLQEMVNQFEATNPSFNPQEKQRWELVQTKVKLLEVFHEQKKKLVADDLEKNRAMIRAHANGIVKRAQLLQKSVSTLQRLPLS